jgi:hypothetical protein
MSSTSAKFIVLGVILLALAATGFGQGGATGAIAGTVQDASGAVVANADVTLTNQETNVLERSVKTGPDGTFTAPLLPVGTYSVGIHAAGFADGKFADVGVHVTETTRMTAKLATQSVQQKIEVQAEVQAVDTSDATTGQAIESNTIRALPLATQNFQQLLTLSTGAQSELNAAAHLGRGDVRIQVNGQREDNNNYLIEGVSVTDYNVAELTNTPLPNPDVVQQFKVQTSLYDASQGRNGGGNINAILKSGTSKFHGDAYEFFRNTVLDANEYFLKGSGAPRPVIQQNIFGGSLGGPVSPGGKLGFFFVNYQGTRQRSGDSPGTLISTFIPYVPASDRGAANAATLAADFGVASADPLAVSLLGFQSSQFGAPANGYLYPAPNVTANPGDLVQFTVSKPGKFTDDQFTANWDHDFRDSKDSIAARFFYSNSETDVPFGAGGLQASLGAPASGTDLNFPYQLPVHDRVFVISETHVFSPRLVNDFRFGLVHINNTATNINPVTVGDVGIDRPTDNLTSSIYKFTLLTSGFQFGPTPQANQSQKQNNYNFVDDLSWVHGAHTVTVGGQYVRVRLNKLFPQVFNGQLFFTNTTDTSTNITTTDFGNFVGGTPEFSFGGGGVDNHAYKQSNSAIFAQDDWKATQTLSLNLGLRTEFLGAWTDGDCHIGNIESDLTNSGTYPFIYPSCVDKLGVAGLSGNAAGSTFRNSVSTGWGPRVGFAWDVMGRHTTTLRGGYGIYYVREDVGAVDQLSFQSPFIPIVFFGQTPGFTMSNFFTGTPAVNPNAVPQAGQLSGAWLPCLAQFTGFVDGNGIPTNDTTQTGTYNSCSGPGVNTTQNLFVLEVPRHFVVPNTQQWNLTAQRELGRNWILEVGYVGTRGIHLRETRDGIQSVDATKHPLTITDTTGNSYTITTDTFSNAIARTPSPGLNGYSGYQLFANDAYSIYHALQATVSRRWSKNYFQAAYTFSKNIDATSTGNTAFNTAYNDQSNINASRGISDFNRPHRLSVSYAYDLPFFEHSSGITKAALGGWQVSGVTIFQSGLPFSIFDTSAGTAFLGAGSTPLLGASLASGATIASGLTSGDLRSRVANGYVNPGAFMPAPLVDPADCALDGNFCGTGFGDLARNLYHGPFQQNWDVSFLKHFRVGEHQDIRFAADFFNIWNHTNFGVPTVTDIEAAGSGAFGKIVQTNGNPRLIQFSLRWAF